MFNSIPAVLPLAKSGKVRALGVGGPKRSVAAPDVPTIAETIPGFECVNWYAMLAPAKTPPAIVTKLNAEIVKMIADPPFAQRLIDLGLGAAVELARGAARLHAQGVRTLGPRDQGGRFEDRALKP